MLTSVSTAANCTSLAKPSMGFAVLASSIVSRTGIAVILAGCRPSTASVALSFADEGK